MMKNSHKTIIITLIFQLLFGAFIIARGVGAISSGVVTSLFGGVGGSIPYQSAANTTAFLANGSAGQVFTSNGTTLAPSWTTISAGVGGTGTNTHVPMFTAASTIADTPLTWNGSSYFFTNTGATATFTEALTPSAATAGLWHIGSSTHQIFIDEAAGSTLISVKDTGGITLSNQTANFTFNFDPISQIITANLASTGQFRLASAANTSSFRLDGINSILLQKTITPGGTTGAQTINKPAGTINFGIGIADITVTNSTVSSESLIFCTVQSSDATAISCRVTDKAAGSFHLRVPAATAETSVAFLVTN